MRYRVMAAWLVITTAAGLLLPGSVQAGSKGRKTTALILTGVAAHQLLTGHTTTGIIAGAGARLTAVTSQRLATPCFFD